MVNFHTHTYHDNFHTHPVLTLASSTAVLGFGWIDAPVVARSATTIRKGVVTV